MASTHSPSNTFGSKRDPAKSTNPAKGDVNAFSSRSSEKSTNPAVGVKGTKSSGPGTNNKQR